MTNKALPSSGGPFCCPKRQRKSFQNGSITPSSSLVSLALRWERHREPALNVPLWEADIKEGLKVSACFQESAPASCQLCAISGRSHTVANASDATTGLT
jgi:hypothetical protein